MALAAGAAAGLKPVAENAVKDAYAGIKRLVQDKYSDVDIVPLEQKPDSKEKRDSLTKDLVEAGAASDEDLRTQAQELAALIEQHDASAAATVGIDIAKVKTGLMEFGDVETTAGTGVRIRETEAEGMKFGNVRTGPGTGTENPPRE
jgi:hypothetical protein